MEAAIGDARKFTATIAYNGDNMIVNWVVTIRSTRDIERRMFTAFEEAFEFACVAKSMRYEYRITLKRERREFEYWLSLIVGNALQAT